MDDDCILRCTCDTGHGGFRTPSACNLTACADKYDKDVYISDIGGHFLCGGVVWYVLRLSLSLSLLSLCSLSALSLPLSPFLHALCSLALLDFEPTHCTAFSPHPPLAGDTGPASELAKIARENGERENM